MGARDMKNSSAFFNSPLRLVAAVCLIALAPELLIMLLIASGSAYLKGIPEAAWVLLDAIALTAIVAPALYLLILRPMRSQQTELERQLDELLRFQKLTVGRELRMKELAEENAALRN